MSLRETILAANDIESEIVDIPAWGVQVEVRSMDGRSRAKMLASAAGENGEVNLENLYPEMVILCSFDPETGERIFEPSDTDALLAKSAGPLEQVALAAMRVSGMTKDALDVEGKDSLSTESTGSTSN